MSSKGKAKKPNGGSLKQGSLFSFFSKASSKTSPKVSPTKKAAKPSSGGARSLASQSQPSPSKSPKPSPDNNANKTKNVNSPSSGAVLSEKVSLGCRVGIYWPDDGCYYYAAVTKQQGSTSKFFLEYDDGESEWLDLSTEKIKVVNGGNGDNGDKKSEKEKQATNSSSAGTKRRRQIEEESDEEHEWDDKDGGDDDDDDDGSVYDPNVSNHKDDNKHDDDLEGDWMVTDDEDDAAYASGPTKKKAKKYKRSGDAKSLTVIRHKAPASSSSSFSTTTAPQGPFKTPLGQFANTVSPQSNTIPPKLSQDSPRQVRKTLISSASSSPAKSSVPSRPELTPGSKTNQKKNNTSSQGAPPKALPYTKGIVNPAGSHVHNHLRFLQQPKDSQGRRKGEAGYDPRTLQVRPSEWEQHVGKMTNAVQQWWDLKSRYFDTILLFKTGKFYEMFHMDADIGVDVLALTYMKGHIAHAGFPEISYGSMADKLVRAGYKVARVEQTETQEQFKQRKQRTKGKKPQVVNREVCSIMSLGTRTFCCLDDNNALMDDNDAENGCGPLLSIREILIDPMDAEPTSSSSPSSSSQQQDDEDEVRPVCEYGITLVDSVRATVTVGQFADDVLRSRMNTLLTTYNPSEILVEGGENGASQTLMSLIKSFQNTSRHASRTETIQPKESFPKSTALDPDHRRELERRTSTIRPWNVDETLDELHRRRYYPRGSRKKDSNGNTKPSTSRWPKVLQAVVQGGADLCVSSFGAALFYLQRNLIDQEILSMGIVKAYIPPASSCISDGREQHNGNSMDAVMQQTQEDEEQSSAAASGLADTVSTMTTTTTAATPLNTVPTIDSAEGHIKHMSLDGTTLHNLEILTNSVDHKVSGSLWSKINFTKSPHGARMLRAWLLRPLFRKADIERRADAVEELVAGAGAVALNEARQQVLGKVGDLDRLLSRVHSMSGGSADTDNGGDDASSSVTAHPNERAVLYESATYTKRKVGDFSRVLNGLRCACQIPELFADIQLRDDGLLRKVVKYKEAGGCFPNMAEDLDWFFDNFDCDRAAKGFFEPSRGVDEVYDDACDAVERIKSELEDYRRELCSQLKPAHVAKSSWKYINLKPDSKDKYLIELPASIAVPDDFIIKGKRGSGAKQVNKYRTSFVANLVHDLEQAQEVQSIRKAKGMQLIFAKFDSKRSLWAAAAHATGILDALGSLAKTASKSGFCRPKILDCPADLDPTVRIVQGRHPCVETSVHADEFVPNDLCLGRAGDDDKSRLLLLSGPNMGGKSTLLRQTCLIAILAQIGSYVPAEECELTPIDCIYTRLGASDRILLGQSTFFVELAETAAALRGATRRSLVIMDELGRGTSTFDGTAIAGATVKHLIQRSRCLSLFATHYHSLLDEWKDEPMVRLGHMQCVVEEANSDDDDDNNGDVADSSITFLYTLGPGTCPKSFGINVARLASLPTEVLKNAKEASAKFEEEMIGGGGSGGGNFLTSHNQVLVTKQAILDAIQSGNIEQVKTLWNQLQQ